MKSVKNSTPVGDQLIGSAVDALNQVRIDVELFQLTRQDIAFGLA